MATMIQTGFVAILNAIQTQLLAHVSGLTSSMIKWTAHPDPIPHFDGEHDVVLRVGSFISPTVVWEASTVQRIRRFLTVYPRSRYAGDPKDRDTQWLLGSTYSHFTWEENILRALWGWFPNDAADSTAGNLLAQAELQMATGTDPVKGALDLAWGDSAITFEVQYLFSLGQPSVVG